MKYKAEPHICDCCGTNIKSKNYDNIKDIVFKVNIGYNDSYEMRSEYENQSHDVEICSECSKKIIDYAKEHIFTSNDLKQLLNKSNNFIISMNKLKDLISVFCKVYRDKHYYYITDSTFNKYYEDENLEEYF